MATVPTPPATPAPKADESPGTGYVPSIEQNKPGKEPPPVEPYKPKGEVKKGASDVGSDGPSVEANKPDAKPADKPAAKPADKTYPG
jgi:hypothetical protein